MQLTWIKLLLLWCRAALTANALLAHTYSFSNRNCGGFQLLNWMHIRRIPFSNASVSLCDSHDQNIRQLLISNLVMFSARQSLLSSTLKMDGRLRPLVAAKVPASRLFPFSWFVKNVCQSFLKLWPFPLDHWSNWMNFWVKGYIYGKRPLSS